MNSLIHLNPDLISYYRLLSIQDTSIHPVNFIKPVISMVFTQTELTLYFREFDGKYVLRENVIGGDETDEPVVVYST